MFAQNAIGFWSQTGLAAPTGLTLTLISGGVKIDWTDNSGGTAQTEIWGQSDGAAYALLYTIAAGIVTKNDLLNPVDLRYYMIRSVLGGIYSEFTPAQSIAMLGAELLANMSTWTKSGAMWTWNVNKWQYANSSGGHIDTPAPVVNGDKYRMRFEILDRPAGIKVNIYDNAGYVMFGAPWNTYTVFDIPAGILTYYILCIRDLGTNLQFWGAAAGGNFSIKDFSLKKILFP